MKNILLVILLATLSFINSSCKKKIGTFTLSNEAEAIIPATNSLLPFSILTPEMTNNSSVEFENNNTKADYIKSINLRELKITIEAPTGEDFSFLNSVDIYISSTNYAEQKVAFKENVPATIGGEISCEIVEADLQNFIKDDKLKIRVATKTDETIAEDVKIKINSSYLVSAKLIK